MTEKEFVNAKKIFNSLDYSNRLQKFIISMKQSSSSIETKRDIIAEFLSKNGDETPCSKTHDELLLFLIENISKFAFEHKNKFEDKLHKL